MTGPDFTKRGGNGPQYDPVTGAPLPTGPAAYSAIDPPQYPDPFGASGGPASGPPTGYGAGYPGTGYPAAHQSVPGYPPAGYGAPGYGAPGYGPPGQPVNYPPAGYQMVPMYPVAQRPSKPGGATAAAVLAYVQSGFVLLGGIAMFSGSAGLDSLSRGSDLSAELTVIGIITVIAGGLLIAGATTLLNRKPALLLVGCALSVAVSLYFILRLMNFFFAFGLWVPILYAVLPVIAIALACSSDVRAWVRARNYDQA